jgi:hypothetical protein
MKASDKKQTTPGSRGTNVKVRKLGNNQLVQVQIRNSQTLNNNHLMENLFRTNPQ